MSWGSLTSLGYTNKTTFVYDATSSENYTFVIKSAYSIFKNNMSDGLKITANLSNSNIPDTDDGDKDDDKVKNTGTSGDSNN